MSLLLVFVPGIMGSALRYKGPGPLGDPIEEYVWGEDITDLFSSDKLDWLRYPTPKESRVEATHIIERVVFYGVRVLSVEKYASLLSRWRQLANRLGVEFMEFAYDWRQSILTSALTLTRRVMTVVSRRQIEKIVLVGHSMGGLVCLPALHRSEELSARVSLLVHIATPLRGSVRAFYALKVAPRLSPAADVAIPLMSIWDVYRRFRRQAGLFDKFMTAIRSCPSVYELLPPKQIQPLVTDTGRRRGCVEDDIWDRMSRPLINQARKTHNLLAQTQRLVTPLITVYSAEFDTDNTYRVRGNPPYAFDGEVVFDGTKGDGIVTVDSATAWCPPPGRYRETTPPHLRHGDICRNPATLRYLEEQIFGVSYQGDRGVILI